MHRIKPDDAILRRTIADLTMVGFSVAQAKALIITIKRIHDGPSEPAQPKGKGNG